MPRDRFARDAVEVATLEEVFGSHSQSLLVSSTKSMHGHTLGAAAALEAVATVLALREGIAPPTCNFTEPDPYCDLDFVRNIARSTHLEYAISNSFAFGGLNAVLVFRRPPEPQLSTERINLTQEFENGAECYAKAPD